jgi:hypothetical protein
VAAGVLPPSVVDGSVRAVSTTGAQAKISAVDSVATSAKPSTGPSTATSVMPVTVNGARATSTGTAR